MKSERNKVIAAMFAVLFITATFAVSQLNAQTRHEFLISLGGGLSSLNYKPVKGQTTDVAGFSGGLGYNVYFNKNIGLGVGAEMSVFGGNYTLSEFGDAYQRHDGEEYFEYRYTLNDLTETQQAMLINIPLMLRIQTGAFYAAAGGKVGIPLNAEYKSKVKKLDASGYYERADLLLKDPRFMGFGEFTDLHSESEFNLQPAFFASVELGIKLRLSDKSALYAGVFLDYALNNTLKTPSINTYLIDYKANDRYSPNSVLQSSTNSHAMVQQMHPFFTGVKISLAFGNFKKQSKTEESKEESKTTAGTEQRPAGTEQRPAGEQRPGNAQRSDTVRRSGDAQRPAGEYFTEEERYALELGLMEKLQQYEIEQIANDEAIMQEDAKERIRRPIYGFGESEAILSETQKADLDEIALLLQRYSYKNILIEGHACNTGTHRTNLYVGEQRAIAVKEYLIKKGVPAWNINAVSKGETEPVLPNTSEENMYYNRRVEIKVY